MESRISKGAPFEKAESLFTTKQCCLTIPLWNSSHSLNHSHFLLLVLNVGHLKFHINSNGGNRTHKQTGLAVSHLAFEKGDFSRAYVRGMYRIENCMAKAGDTKQSCVDTIWTFPPAEFY